jgi:hypothetical protein
MAMRLIKDAIDGPMVDFQTATAASHGVFLQAGGGFVRALGVANLTGPSGKAAWGAAIPPPSLLETAGWERYR